MTAKHLIEGAMQHIKANNHKRFAMMTGLDDVTVHRIAHGRAKGMRIETLDQIQRTTGVPIETLFRWYRLPDGEALGRIRESA